MNEHMGLPMDPTVADWNKARARQELNALLIRHQGAGTATMFTEREAAHLRFVRWMVDNGDLDDDAPTNVSRGYRAVRV